MVVEVKSDLKESYPALPDEIDQEFDAHQTHEESMDTYDKAMLRFKSIKHQQESESNVRAIKSQLSE